MIQINHGGSQVDGKVVRDVLSPSGIATNETTSPRAMTNDEVLEIVDAFGQAARRAREAGFDGVQIHGAHGYLTTQFLSPHTNRRTDAWGGDSDKRRGFLVAVCENVREAVGEDYAVWIKLGVAGSPESGLTLEDGALAAKACFDLGIECVELSHASGEPEGIGRRADPHYLPMAQAVRNAVGPDAPIALVSGFRTRQAMDGVLDGGLAQIISLCRPLISEPDLPNKLKDGRVDAVACTRCDQCRPGNAGEPIACHNETVIAGLGTPSGAPPVSCE